MSDKVACPECGKEYSSLGNHWQWNPKHRPEFTQQQKEIITGLVMADGCINRGGKKPRLTSNMISSNYLKYIDDIFGCLSTGVSLKLTAKENARRDRNSRFNANAKAKNYSNIYNWKTRRHPDLQQWADWYSTGEKLWPEDIELTPTVLKHWYCGDGNWENSGTSNRIKISMENEMENIEKVLSMFINSGLPKPSTHSGHKIVFTVDKSKELWEYMGKPLPDFYYKWPEQYH